MEQDAPQPALDQETEVGSKQAEFFEALARTAEAIAETEDESAAIHDKAQGPDAAEHAARARRFADAERAAASAYRNHKVPSDDVRRAIREVNSGTDGQ